MQVRPIEASDIGSAVALTERGFAQPPHATWAAYFEQLINLQGRQLNGPIGYLLCKDDAAVGIILTLRSRRGGEHAPQPDVVNIASWYIDEPHRWYAPMMLKKILRNKDAVFTDLTASAEVRKMLPALKFRTWTDGVLTASLPLSLSRFRRDATITDCSSADVDQLDARQRTLLRDHAAMGCVACVLTVDGTRYPLVFKTRYRRSIPHAYLIYTTDRRVVLSALGNVCLYLLKHGHFLIALDCNEQECSGARTFRKTTWHKYVFGPANEHGIDYAYSELVYMDCP